MNLLEYFAAHDTAPITLNPESVEAIGMTPKQGDEPSLEWAAKAIAKLRFIRAQAMVEEAERHQSKQPVEQCDCEIYEHCPICREPAAPKAAESSSETLFLCPECGGPHFNIGNNGTLKCTNWRSAYDTGGCGWRGKQHPTKTTGLSFSEALVAMKEGKRVRRPLWTGFMHKVGGNIRDNIDQTRWMLDSEDLLAEDWAVVP